MDAWGNSTTRIPRGHAWLRGRASASERSDAIGTEFDLFSYIGGFSGAAGAFILRRDLDLETDYNGVPADPAAFAKRVKVLWLGVGTAEPEGMRSGIRKPHASLTEAGITHVSQESPGTDHDWQTWRRNLDDFAARLFR